MAIKTPGIYLDMSAADYYADPCPLPSFTQSLAKVLVEHSPRHAMLEHPRLHTPAEDDETEKYIKAQAIGSAAHHLMLGRGKELEVRDYDSWRGKASAERAEIEAGGKVAILGKHYAVAQRMVLAAGEQLAAAGLDAFMTGTGHGEVCLAWQEEDGLWFRSLVDWLPDDMLIPYDYKTTAMSCAPWAVPRLMAEGGWDLQAAMHERGLEALDPDNAGRRRFRFIAQENTEPFALVAVELTEAVMTVGRKKLDYAIARWRQCMRSGVWPGYPPELLRPELPAWNVSAWLTREEAEALERPAGNVIMAG